MRYNFTISHLEILNALIFDASIEYSDLQKQSTNGQIEYQLERRSFENVKRSKLFFLNITHFKGITSVLKLFGLKEIKLSNIDNRFTSNHFINEFQFEPQYNFLKLETSFGLSVLYHIENDFSIELDDISESDFGSGYHIGLHGFTNEEWYKYLIDKNYDLQSSRLPCQR